MMFQADSLLVDIVIPASRFRIVQYRKINLVTIHATQTPVGSGRAVARDFASIPITSLAPRSSTYIADASEIIQTTRECDICDAAPPNDFQIAIEQCGYSEWTWTKWLASGVPQQSSRLAADVLTRNRLPAVFIDEEALLDSGAQGLTTHHRITKACRLAKTRGLTQSPYFLARNDHTDPDGNTPDGWNELAFLGMVLDELPSDYAASLMEDKVKPN